MTTLPPLPEGARLCEDDEPAQDGDWFWFTILPKWMEVRWITGQSKNSNGTTYCTLRPPREKAQADPLKTQQGGDHYKNMAIQSVEFITANKLNFLEGCVIKRVCRHRLKGGAEDIRKAIHELELILRLEYSQQA